MKIVSKGCVPIYLRSFATWCDQAHFYLLSLSLSSESLAGYLFSSSDFLNELIFCSWSNGRLIAGDRSHKEYQVCCPGTAFSLRFLFAFSIGIKMAGRIWQGITRPHYQISLRIHPRYFWIGNIFGKNLMHPYGHYIESKNLAAKITIKTTFCYAATPKACQQLYATVNREAASDVAF